MDELDAVIERVKDKLIILFDSLSDKEAIAWLIDPNMVPLTDLIGEFIVEHARKTRPHLLKFLVMK